MNPRLQFNRWFDIRGQEFRPLVLSIFGAFLIIGFMILARSLREALYLTTFDVKTLPYITVAVAVLGLPTVGIFARLLARYPTQNVVQSVLITVVLGLVILWPLAGKSQEAVVAFYLWTALSTIVLTSGFWIIVSEHFPLRGAKRLFGLISAGGTAGAMVFGTSLSWLTHQFGVIDLIPLAGIILFLIFGLMFFYPKPLLGEGATSSVANKNKTSIREGCENILKNKHLRTIAIIVGAATFATTLLDYQFKELVREGITTKAGLASFFGAFYGWTGAVSLLVQLVITSRFLSKFGIGWTLAVLPLILFFGSLALLIIPTIILVTAVRGMDNSLRKSLHRSALEVLYVPIPSLLRRKTKTFIDSTVDTMAEGLGAALVFLWVTWGNFPSRYLSIAVAVLATCFLYQTRQMHREYFQTLVRRLKEGKGKAQRLLDEDERMEGKDLLSVSFTSLDLEESLKERGIVFQQEPSEPRVSGGGVPNEDPVTWIRSPDPLKVAAALETEIIWSPQHVKDLLRVLTRDSFRPRVTQILAEIGEAAISPLATCLNSEATDFVIRRRIPRILSRINSSQAEDPLLDSLVASRFEIRYSSGVALMKRRKRGLPEAKGDWKNQIWDAVRYEVNREKAVWEVQKLLDEQDQADRDIFVEKHVDIRGKLSLEHTFRLLALVLDPVAVKTAFQGILVQDEKLKSFSLEYLEHVLPRDIREKLWPFIGDISEYQKIIGTRPLKEVVDDLVMTGATLFGDAKAKETLRKALGKIEK